MTLTVELLGENPSTTDIVQLFKLQTDSCKTNKTVFLENDLKYKIKSVTREDF